MGTIKHSKASKKKWAVLSPEERKKKMSVLSEKRWKRTTKKQRSEHARKMVLTRWAKKRDK